MHFSLKKIYSNSAYCYAKKTLGAFHLIVNLQAIQPICLPEEPSSENKYDDRTVHLIGWGSSNKNGKPSETLRRVTIQIFSQRLVNGFLDMLM